MKNLFYLVILACVVAELARPSTDYITDYCMGSQIPTTVDHGNYGYSNTIHASCTDCDEIHNTVMSFSQIENIVEISGCTAFKPGSNGPTQLNFVFSNMQRPISVPGDQGLSSPSLTADVTWPYVYPYDTYSAYVSSVVFAGPSLHVSVRPRGVSFANINAMMQFRIVYNTTHAPQPCVFADGAICDSISLQSPVSCADTKILVFDVQPMHAKNQAGVVNIDSRFMFYVGAPDVPSVTFVLSGEIFENTADVGFFLPTIRKQCCPNDDVNDNQLIMSAISYTTPFTFTISRRDGMNLNTGPYRIDYQYHVEHNVPNSHKYDSYSSIPHGHSHTAGEFQPYTAITAGGLIGEMKPAIFTQNGKVVSVTLSFEFVTDRNFITLVVAGLPFRMDMSRDEYLQYRFAFQNDDEAPFSNSHKNIYAVLSYQFSQELVFNLQYDAQTDFECPVDGSKHCKMFTHFHYLTN